MINRRMTRRPLGVVALACLTGLTLGVLAAPTPASAAHATRNPDFTANAMAPLVITDWAAFGRDLASAASIGVDAVSVDVWWGRVEAAADNRFDWSYYDRVFAAVDAAGLDLVPILSFHRCGGNVGDTCDIPIPAWIWAKYETASMNGITIGRDGLKHRSEQGNVSPETIQGWADALVENEYADFTEAFVWRYGTTYADDVDEISVSLGPAGELRYPSYNSHDRGTGYPSRGALQAYSPLAVADFQAWAIGKYGSLSGVNAAWSTSLATTSRIQPPDNPNHFFSSGDYRNIQYGRDFVDWYNGSLVNHGERMLSTVIGALGSAFPGADIGYKIPGIHWSMGGPTPRAAEVAAGMIQTSLDLDSSYGGHGYRNIVSLGSRFAGSGRSVVLHFTALEMDDANVAPQYSLAKSLVGWVATEAQWLGVPIKGENALAGGIGSDHGWDNVVAAFDAHPYVGFTALRLSDIASGTGARRYEQFIDRYRPTPWPSLFIRGTNNGWGTTAMTKSGTVWSATVAFGAASGQAFKFDVLGDWSDNYGGPTTTGPAVPGGSNIPVASNTTYRITFDEATLVYSATPVP